MDFNVLIERATVIQRGYRTLNERDGHAPWTAAEYMQGFVGDVGDLAKLVMAKNNFRHMDDLETKLGHELADCLWSIIVLSTELGIDLQQAFISAVDELESHINASMAAHSQPEVGSDVSRRKADPNG